MNFFSEHLKRKVSFFKSKDEPVRKTDIRHINSCAKFPFLSFMLKGKARRTV